MHRLHTGLEWLETLTIYQMSVCVGVCVFECVCGVEGKCVCGVEGKSPLIETHIGTIFSFCSNSGTVSPNDTIFFPT